MSLESLASQLGEYFQIRDDYKNLAEEVRNLLPVGLDRAALTLLYSILVRKASVKILMKENYRFP